MKSMKFGAVLVAGVLMLAGCGGGDAEPEKEAVAQDASEEVATSEDLEPCFTVGEVGSRLSLDWELVVASRGASDQPGYIEDVASRVAEFYEDLDYDIGCAGGTELSEFGKKLSPLKEDAEQGQDSDEQYQEIADLGNELLDLSDDQGDEWDYKFVTDVSEIDP